MGAGVSAATEQLLGDPAQYPPIEETTVHSLGVSSAARLGKSRVPVAVQVAHYMPSTFPLVPEMRLDYIAVCRKSWQSIVQQRQRLADYGADIHGITLFYNEFYERLERIDVHRMYESVLMRHAVGTNRIAAKGAILVRIVDFILKLDGDSPKSKAKLRHMGLIHKQKGVRPWQYAVFLEMFVHTLSSRLGEVATTDVMEAWVNVLGYTLQEALPAALEGVTFDSEAYATVRAKHSDGSITLRNPDSDSPFYRSEQPQRRERRFQSKPRSGDAAMTVIAEATTAPEGQLSTPELAPESALVLIPVSAPPVSVSTHASAPAPASASASPSASPSPSAAETTS